MTNKGLDYERMIKSVLIGRNLLPVSLLPRLVQTQNDAGFVHQGKEYFLEVKNRDAPDYGARQIDFDKNTYKWKWNNSDQMTQLFDNVGLLNKVKNFTPKKFIIEDRHLTEADKRFDRTNFAGKVSETDLDLINMGTSGAKILHEYYAKKDCYYIQIEGKGFYYMKSDPADLKVPQFVPSVVFRMRAKTHGSARISNYSFRVVITAVRSTFLNSTFDIDDQTRFPPIIK